MATNGPPRQEDIRQSSGEDCSGEAPLPDQNQLNSLVALTASTLRHQSLDEVLWDVVQKVVKVLEFEDCLIYFYDEARGELVQKAAYGPKQLPDKEILGPLSIKLGSGVVGSCAATLETVLVKDTCNDPRYIVDDQPRFSELSVPIVSDGKLVGVIDSESSQRDFYTAEHVQLLTAVAAIIATKYEGHKAIDELQQTVLQLERAERLQQALFNIAELVHTTDSLNDFYLQLHQNVVDLIDAEVFFVALLDESEKFIDIPYPGENETSYPLSPKIDSEQFSVSLIAQVILGNKSILLNEQELETAGLPCSWKAYTWLGVPFVTTSGIRGAVGIQRVRQKADFSVADQELLIHISHHISNAIKRKQDEGTLQRMALSDALTGLPNRTLLMDRLGHALKRDKSMDDFQTHVFFIDLDRFKHINDAYGHHVGDEVLMEVGGRIKSCLRESDTLSRISGDEFAIVLEDIDQQDTLELVARRITGAFKTPVNTSSGPIKLSASIGVCSASEELHNGEELLKMADYAMYQAKAMDKGDFVIGVQSGSQLIHTRRIEAELAVALDNDELEIHLQPVYGLPDKNIAGFEALVRWRHPEMGLLYPDSFLDIAEKSGQITALDSYMLNKSAQLFQQLYAATDRPLYFNVNISGRTLSSTEFVGLVRDVYSRYQLPPGCLNIEVTEQCLVGDLQSATECLKEVNRLGSKIFLDDFGTGYSSLNYLHRLPIDVLKIDRSFVQSYHESTAVQSIVKTIVILAKNLGIKVVAEGIEEDCQLVALTDLAVDYGQGYFLSRPIPVEQAKRLLLAGTEL